MSTRSRLLAMILVIATSALGFGGGYLLGRRAPSVSAGEIPVQARALPDASAAETGVAELLDEASHANKDGLSALLKRVSGDRLQRELVALMLAESDPHRMLAYLKSSWESNHDVSHLRLCQSLFRIWAAASPDAAIKAVEGIADRALRAEAVRGTLDCLFGSNPGRAGDLMVQWQFDFPFSGPLPDWFDANPAEGLALLADLATSHLGSKMKWGLPQRWGKNDPTSAISWMESHPDNGMKDVIPDIIASWIESDLPGAEAALQAGRFTDTATVESLTKAIARTHARENPVEALAWAAELLTGDQKASELVNTVNNWAKDDLPSAVEWTLAQTDADTQQRAFSTLAGEWAKVDARSAADFALGIVSRPVEIEDDRFLRSIGTEFVKTAPTAALDWADKLPDALRARTETTMFQNLLQQDREAALAEFSGRIDQLSRNTVENFASSYFRADPNAAKEWLESLPKGENRELVSKGFRAAASRSEMLKAADAAF